MNYSVCDVCPRGCLVDRSESVGFCSSTSTVKISRASVHHWEEPCISGKNGSGTIFFIGCNMQCVYCQNYKISNGEVGIEISEDKLEELLCKINNSSVHNINLVTPTHYTPTVATVLKRIKHKLTKPIVYNCSGYESTKSLEELRGLVDIYLTDFKYYSNTLAKKYSSCSNYCEMALSALTKMLELVGKPVLDDGIMKSGVIVRHLILPTHKKDSIDVLNTLYENFGNKNFLVSLMSQFTPTPNCKNFPELNRALTSLEYQRVTEVYEKLGFDGYLQRKEASSTNYIPDFNDKGEFLL